MVASPLAREGRVRVHYLALTNFASPFRLRARCDVLCRSVEGSPHNVWISYGKVNIGSALPAPGAATRFENLRRLLDECAAVLA